MKVAVTEVVAAAMVTVHEPAPLHAPPHELKLQPEEGAPLSVTSVPLAYACEQADPQLINPSLLLTVPLPDDEIVKVSLAPLCVKVAVTVWAEFMSTVQPVPELTVQPAHPLKLQPDSEAAVSETAVPLAKA